MELLSNVRVLYFVRKLLLGDVRNILPFPVRPQKPAPAAHRGVLLPRCTPEEAQVPASALEELLCTLAKEPDIHPHNVYVLRHGCVLCEGHFAPYTGTQFHVSHSLCKSFTGTAIGMLIDEGRLSLDDTLGMLLPEKCTFLTSRKMRGVTVRQLLTMRSGVNFREMGSVLDKDWAAAFLSSDFLFEPGTDYQYNSMNSYMLSVIVTQKTGLTLFDYLKPRLFEPLGFGSVAWETCPMGYTKGGWGMYVLPEDLAKLGLLYLQKGEWHTNGVRKRLLSEAWVQQATKTVTALENGEEYGYQVWTHKADGSFLFNGMFGQYVAVQPTLDMVVVINAGSTNLFTQSAALDAIKTLYARVQASDAAGFVLPARREKDSLQHTLENLRFATPVPDGRPAWYLQLRARLLPRSPQLPQACDALAGKAYLPAENHYSLLPLVISYMCDYYASGITRIAFVTQNDVFTVLWTENGVEHALPVGFDTAKTCELNFGGNRFCVAVSGAFVTDEDENPVLKLTVNFLEATSTQCVKLFLLPKEMVLRLAETPALSAVMEQMKRTNPDMLNINMNIFKDLGYFKYLVEKFCDPCVRCKPEESLENK